MLGPIRRRGVDAVRDVGVAGLAERDDPPVADADVALTTPQWSSTTAFVITRSGAPSARVVVPWSIDSRIVLPPPKTASSPPTQSSRSTSIQRSVSASRTWSPVVGP